MRLLADESVESGIERVLRDQGHDLLSIAQESPGAKDADVLDHASREARVLLTNDKDFAELAFRQQRASAGILLIRMPRSRTAAKAKRVAEVLREQGRALGGAMTVVDTHAIRRRPLPGPAKIKRS